MKIYGKIIRERKIVREAYSENNQPEVSFHDKLEFCLVDVCAKLDIQVPLWLNKNTKEFAAYRKTFFTNEQFMEKVWFDKLEIELEK